MSIDTIGGKLYSNHPKNMNRAHKYNKDLLSIIITLGKYKWRGGSVL